MATVLDPNLNKTMTKRHFQVKIIFLLFNLALKVPNYSFYQLVAFYFAFFFQKLYITTVFDSTKNSAMLLLFNTSLFTPQSNVSQSISNKDEILLQKKGMWPNKFGVLCFWQDFSDPLICSTEMTRGATGIWHFCHIHLLFEPFFIEYLTGLVLFGNNFRRNQNPKICLFVTVKCILMLYLIS